MERETGIEPATNSLEGCDSTTELLPPSSGLEAEKLHADFPMSHPDSSSWNFKFDVSNLVDRGGFEPP